MNLSIFDKALLQFDGILRAKFKATSAVTRANPAAHLCSEPELTSEERQQSISMMRINHSGEVCAQALYQGQAFMARSPQQYQLLTEAAAEETDHLAWCKQRLMQLQGRTSLLNPVWYGCSFALGVAAGMAGDKISLGFLAETEQQVTEHIENHLRTISPKDEPSKAILLQMREDELKHATTAQEAGGRNLPVPLSLAMRFSSKVFTWVTARI